MGSTYVTNPVVFLLNTIFSLYILAVMLRFLLQWVRADFRNPVAQALVKITNPPLKPLRRFIPGVGGIDIASIILMLIVQVIALALIAMVVGVQYNLVDLLLTALAELLSLLINVFLFSILIQVIISWVNPGAYNPVLAMVYSLNEPLLRPARRYIPPIGELDLSPLVVAVALQVLKMLLIPPIYRLADMV